MPASIFRLIVSGWEIAGLYDNYELSRRALTVALTGICGYFLFSFLCLLAYPRKKKGKEKKEEQELDHTHTDEREEPSIKKEKLSSTDM